MHFWSLEPVLDLICGDVNSNLATELQDIYLA
jgi:hypothetical protein